MFIECLADALRNAAMNLAAQRDRVDDDAKIINHGVALDLGEAGGGINLNLDNMTPMRIGRPGRFIGMIHVIGMRALRRRKPDHKLLQPNRQVAVPGEEQAIGKADIGRGAAKMVRRMGCRLSQRLSGNMGNTRTVDNAHSGATGGARGCSRRIPLPDGYPVGVIPKPVRQDLRQRSAMRLAIVLHASQQENGTIRLKADLDALITTAITTLFKIHGGTKTAQLASGLAFGAAGVKAEVIRACQRLFHHARHVTNVNRTTNDHLIGHVLRSDQIAAPHLDTADADMHCHMIHQSFHQVVRLRPAGPAIGIDRRCICHDTKHPEAGMWNAVICCQRPRPRQGRHTGSEIGQPGPQIDMHGHLSRVDPALMVDKSTNAAAVVTPLQIR